MQVRRNTPARLVTAAALTAVVSVSGLALSACGSRQEAGGPVEVEFFQFKPEAVKQFQGLVDAFNAANPGIRVVQNDQPDADTAIRVRLVKDDVPDVMTLNVNGAFAELAQADVFHDFAREPVLQNVTEGAVKIVTDLGTAQPGQVPGVPFAMNADGIVYNKAIFAKHAIAVPKTWTQLVAACDKLKAAGVVPVYGTLKMAWTTLPAFNALTGQYATGDFWKRRDSGGLKFATAWREPLAKEAKLFSYAQPNKFSVDYDSGNQAFAQGKSAMLLQGSWAIPVIRGFKPNFDIGVFPYPATDDPAKTMITSGVDVALTAPKNGPHHAEAMKFIEFLMRPENVRAYVKAQSAVPTLKNLDPTEPALRDLTPYYDQDKVIGFTDHHIPLSVTLDAFLQQYLIDGNLNGFLSTLDDEWDKVAKRRPSREQK